MNKDLGQFFTPPDIVDKMVGLRVNQGSILEPSVGDGAFFSVLENTAVGIEIDGTVVNNDRVIVGDFFAYSNENKFDTIIGNPPYVRYNDIAEETKNLLDNTLLDKRSNLYLFFIKKCLNHLNPNGELIFITPRDFLKATSARKLNELLYNQGSMSHYYELGDKKIFKDAAPNCAIWRWEKGRTDRNMQPTGMFQCRSGQILFNDYSGADSSNLFGTTLGDFFDIKVGAVSGADDAFVSEKNGCTDMVYSRTAKTGETRRVIYNRKDDSLYPHKKRLLMRGIRRFDESNWWEWGRKFCQRTGPRIYVNGKTRNKKPFFVSEVESYDGSVLALFPKKGINIEKALEKLNNTDWATLGFVCDGRLIFSQRSLSTTPVEVL